MCTAIDPDPPLLPSPPKRGEGGGASPLRPQNVVSGLPTDAPCRRVVRCISFPSLLLGVRFPSLRCAAHARARACGACAGEGSCPPPIDARVGSATVAHGEGADRKMLPP